MSLTASVIRANGRPVLAINGQPTTETWCYGWPNAMEDFTAAGLRICQFHVNAKSWWAGPGLYNFAPIENQIDEFLEKAPPVLLVPRVCFGYEGEGWWAQAHPDQLSVGCDINGKAIAYSEVGVSNVECWQSAASEIWTRNAADAMTAFVRHFETRNPENILGYQIGAGVSVEWFRWWNFADGVYEDYSPAAQTALRKFLRERYQTAEILQKAWNRADVTFATAEVPTPQRLHQPQLGFLRDINHERDVIDWLECFSECNAAQIIALCRAAKRACAGRKLVGTFYGYLWPHWNTQNPARSGHIALARVLECEEIDYISSPYHYDNRGVAGVHTSQTIPQAIERAGKLHLDEIDTVTHLSDGKVWSAQFCENNIAKSPEISRAWLRRDAAFVLGEGGSAWWMDLLHQRWYADETLQAEVRDVNVLARQSLAWPAESHAEAAFVIDDRSYAYCDLNSNLNLYFTSLPRQFEWSALGFPWDTILLSGIGRARDYKLYVFLNPWRVNAETRRAIHRKTRRPGVTAVWFHAAGFYDESCGDEALLGELTGITVQQETQPAIPEIEIRQDGHPLLEETNSTPRGNSRFGARLAEDRARRTVHPNPRGWDTPMSPIFTVADSNDSNAAMLGDYVHNGKPGLACLKGDGWRSIYCGAPMLPGWFLHRLAANAGVHLYAPLGCVVYHRGPLISIYAPSGCAAIVQAPRGQSLTPLAPSGSQHRWQPVTTESAAERLEILLQPGETRFLLAQSA